MQAGILQMARARNSSGQYARWGKRGIDLCLTLLTGPLWAPLLALLWIAARLEAGQGFYADIRIGRGGIPFRCWKIRTMYPGQPRLCAARKLQGDPRVTRLGRFLRRSSLDELPQLWCVLRGRMSLVGPRPVPRTELTRYAAQARMYLQLRPGLTGLWQVSGRNALPYPARVALDARYAAGITLAGDLRILLATLREVLRMSGR